VSAYGNFSVDVTGTKPWFNRAIPAVYLNYNSAPHPIRLSSYFSDPNNDTLTMTATYNLGANSAVNIPGDIFT
jgi:hypothetical protein